MYIAEVGRFGHSAPRSQKAKKDPPDDLYSDRGGSDSAGDLRAFAIEAGGAQCGQRYGVDGHGETRADAEGCPRTGYPGAGNHTFDSGGDRRTNCAAQSACWDSAES